MTQFLTLILMAIIVEGLITYTKTFLVGGKPQWQMLVGLALGIVVALVYNVDIFALLGITATVPFVGAILTGILISRGSNYIFDLVKALQGAGGDTAAAAIQTALQPLLGTINTDLADTTQQAVAVAVDNNTGANSPTGVQKTK